MYDRAMAQEHINDMVRKAEAYRQSRRTKAGAARARQGTVARAKGAIMSVVLWPIRH
jgi:hypothetical protein